MSFDSVERSESGARQTFLYLIEGVGFTYRLTNAPKTHSGTVGGVSYSWKHPRGGISHKSSGDEPGGSDPGPAESTDAGRTGVSIFVSHKNPVIKKHRSFPPPGDTDVTVYRQNEIGGEAQAVWSGTVVETPIEGSVGILRCQHVAELVSGSEGLTETFGPTCPWALGQRPCPVQLADVRDTGTVESIDTDNLEVVISGLSRADGWFRLGVLEAGDGDKRTIDADVFDGSNHVLTLRQNFSSTKLRVGHTVTLVWGDDYTKASCGPKFGLWTGNGTAFGGVNIQSNVNPHEVGRLQ